MRLTVFLLTTVCAAQTRSVTDPGVVTTRQAITPAGVPTIFGGRVYGVAFGESPNELWVLNAAKVYKLDWRANRVIESAATGGTPGLQGLRTRGGEAVITRSRRINNVPTVELAIHRNGVERVIATGLGRQIAGSPSIAGRLAVVPLTADNQVALIDFDSGVAAKVATGIAPFAATLTADGKTAYVTNWGGRAPKPGEASAPTGYAINADRVPVDVRGVASTGTVTRIDIAAKQATHTIAAGLHPTALALDEMRHRLYVANSNSDSISVIDTASNAVIRTIAVQPFATKVKGVAPTALALSPDGATLFAACGGINAIAVIDTASGALRGAIPTAWYPSSLAISADGKRLAVGTLLGPGSGWRDEPKKRFVHSVRGSVAVIDVPDSAHLASYTTAVAENNHMTVARTPQSPRPGIKPVAIPARAGEPSLIEHVVFIIKENRTYDQVLGGIAKGNGDPSLVLFGRDVTPNQHKLAEDFVLLDNFYATGGNSADGHQWLTQANEVAYCMWPGYAGRSYPFDGSDPIAYSEGGFLWDLALNRKKTVRIFGEYAGLGKSDSTRAALLDEWKRGGDFTKRFEQTAPIAPMNKILARNFPAYNINIPDVVRAQIFLAEIEQWKTAKSMPNLVMLQLPSNHTLGTRPGASTPKAMVADNDLALGQVIDALTHSPFWNKMAIFVVEDDAQDGVDHVDGHRTVALAVSPYTRRGHVDSTFYSHQSMLKTIELILGLPTLSLFDLIATDMRAGFTDSPDPAPFTAIVPAQSITEVNPPLRSLAGEPLRAARDSMRMDFSRPDAAPTARLNRIVWHTINGWRKPYPGVRNAVFSPLAVEIDDDDR